MHKNIEFCLAAAAFAAMCLAASAAYAADAVPATSSVMIRCAECGTVSSIRRIEKPVAPERDMMPSTAASPAAGGVGNETQAVPQLSFGRGGAQRVQREPAMRSVWELTVRYDNGEFGLVTRDIEPEFQVGDRVRRIDNTFVPIPQPAR